MRIYQTPLAYRRRVKVKQIAIKSPLINATDLTPTQTRNPRHIGRRRGKLIASSPQRHGYRYIRQTSGRDIVPLQQVITSIRGTIRESDLRRLFLRVLVHCRMQNYRKEEQIYSRTHTKKKKKKKRRRDCGTVLNSRAYEYCNYC